MCFPTDTGNITSSSLGNLLGVVFQVVPVVGHVASNECIPLKCSTSATRYRWYINRLQSLQKDILLSRIL